MKTETFITNDSTKKYVVSLLENYQSDSSKMEALRYEISNPRRVTSEQVIEAMNFRHGDGDGGSIAKGHISNKTLYIATNYNERTETLNREASDEVVDLLNAMNEERKRLLHYISLLKEKDRKIIQETYIEAKTREELSEIYGVSQKSVSAMRKQAVENLCVLYDFTSKYRG